MSSVTLTNTSRAITLSHVLQYRITKQTTVPIKRIPNKTLPTIDWDSRTTMPREISLNVRVSTTDKDTLMTMESDRLLLTMTGNSYRWGITRMDPEYDVGKGTATPWLVTINLLTSDT